jgi:mannosyl-3-phosphoglycerate phosphatase
MSRLEGTIIFTDLDGTLLNHQDYSFDPARAAVDALKLANVPIIPVTSKTKAELLAIRTAIGLDTPFVVENGAGIYIPKEYFRFNDDSLIDAGPYWCKRFAPARSELIALLDNAPASVRSAIRTFSDMTASELSLLTGLSEEQAVLAAEREFSEPIEWTGEDKEASILKDYARKFGYDLVKGGRFFHLTNGYDKGQALYWLKQQFSRANPDQSQFAIALGDSANDIDMLEAADQAIIIKNPHSQNIDLAPGIPIIRSSKVGPEGWAESLNSFLNLDLP